MASTITNISNRVLIPKTCRERFLPLERPALASLREYGVEAGGLSDLCAPFRMGRCAPAFHVAIFTLGGRAGWRTPVANGTFKQGEFWWGPAGSNYEYWSGHRWRVAWFHLNGARSPRELRSLKPGSRVSNVGVQVEAGYSGLLSESLHSGAQSERLVRRYAELLALLLARELHVAPQSDSGPWPELLDALWAKVSGNLQHTWNVEELAAELHVSVVHFHRLVARHQRSSPLAMITKLRMQRAAEILSQTDYKLHQIAPMVGYETPFSFSRAFKQHTGVSPREFRQGDR